MAMETDDVVLVKSNPLEAVAIRKIAGYNAIAIAPVAAVLYDWADGVNSRPERPDERVGTEVAANIAKGGFLNQTFMSPTSF